MPEAKKVLVIGGGAGGLVTLKTILDASRSDPEHPLDPILIEAEAKIGGTFLYRRYENAELVSSRQLTAFSDFRIPPSKKGTHGDHISLEAYVEYLQSYVKHFDLNGGVGWDGQAGRFRMNTRVVRIEKDVSGKHRVHLRRRRVPLSRPDSGTNLADNAVEISSDEYTLLADAIAISSGLHVTPAIPDLPGLEQLQESFHSSAYKGRSQLVGKRVMILGCGETAMDLAYESCKAGATEVTLCHRGGYLSFPKVLNSFELFGMRFDGELPIDGLITNLFETAYVHRWVKRSHLRWFVSDFVIKRVLWFMTGTQAGCNQWVGELPPERLGRAYVFLNKSHKAQCYINKPYKPARSWLNLISRYSDPPEDLNNPIHVDLAPFPTHIREDGSVAFGNSRDGRKEAIRMKDRVVKPEVLIMATGYRQSWDWLGEGYAKGPQDVDTLEMLDSKDISTCWIGHVRPGVGAIPPIAEEQAMLWALLLQGRVPVPKDPGHYRLLAAKKARIQYGVDHSTYSHALAVAFGGAPSLWELYTQYGMQVLMAYCFGAAFTPFYRLVGPYRSPTAPGIIKTEIWEVICRRGLLGNLFMGLVGLPESQGFFKLIPFLDPARYP
ncbi:hypothetical protein EMMF5_001102 [Cystobasidiomycetes sp. EMM_F5]